MGGCKSCAYLRGNSDNLSEMFDEVSAMYGGDSVVFGGFFVFC